MGALLGDAPVVDDADRVRVAHGRETVGDDEARAAFHEAVERALNEQLGAGVDVACGLVEDEHLGPREHDTRDAEQLPLTGADGGGAVEHRIVALRHAADELVGVRLASGLLDLLARGVGTPDRDVLGHGRAPHPGVLQDHAPHAAQRCPREVADVVPVHKDLAGVHVVEAHEEVDEGRLAAAGVAHERDPLAGLGRELDVLEDGAAGNVGERHVPERDLAANLAQLKGVLGIGLLDRLVDELEEVARAGDGVLQLRDDAGDVVERLGVLVGVGEECREPAHGDPAREHDERAEDADRGVDERVHEAHGRVRQRREEDRLVALLRQARVDVGHVGVDGLRHAERLDGRDASDHLLHEAGELAAQLRLPLEVLARVGRDELGGPDREGREDRDHKGDREVQPEHEDERADDGEHAGGELLEAHDEAVRELVGVVHDAARDLAVLVGVDVGQRHVLQVVEGLAAQVKGGVVGQAVRHERERVLGGRGDADRERHDAQRARERGEIDVSGAHDGVDRAARERGERERAHGHHDHEGEKRADHAAARREEPEHPANGLVAQVLLGGCVRGGEVFLAHRCASSLVSWDSQISW